MVVERRLGLVGWLFNDRDCGTIWVAVALAVGFSTLAARASPSKDAVDLVNFLIALFTDGSKARRVDSGTRTSVDGRRVL